MLFGYQCYSYRHKTFQHKWAIMGLHLQLNSPGGTVAAPFNWARCEICCSWHHKLILTFTQITFVQCRKFPVWLSGNTTLVSINVVTLHQARLVPGWVAYFWTGKPLWRRARHPGLLSLSHPSVGRQNEYPAEAGGVNRHIT